MFHLIILWSGEVVKDKEKVEANLQLCSSTLEQTFHLQWKRWTRRIEVKPKIPIATSLELNLLQLSQNFVSDWNLWTIP